MRFRFVKDHRRRWPVQVMCRVLKVTRSGFYAWLKREPSEASSPVNASSVLEGASVTKAQTNNTTLLPERTEVTLGDVTFTLLGLQSAERTEDTRVLTVAVRATNNGGYPINFWNSNFRLLVDDVPQAPIGDLNKVVEGGSAQTGDVVFIYPANSRFLVLRIIMGDTSTDIPLVEGQNAQP